MGKPQKSQFFPKNPQRYIASNIDSIILKSSWERSMAMVLDDSDYPSILGWCYEAIKIPYFNPLTLKNTIYVPDFFVVYIDKNDVKHKELIEIKPQHEVPGFQGKVSKLIETRQVINMLKWKAAMTFCSARNWHFRICTENDLFGFKKKSG